MDSHSITVGEEWGMDRGMLSHWLRMTRGFLGLSPADIAEVMRVSSRTVNSWENDNNANLPSREHLIRYLCLLTGAERLPSPEFFLALGHSLKYDSSSRAKDRLMLANYFSLSHEGKTAISRAVSVLSRVERQRAKRNGREVIERAEHHESRR